MFRGRRLFVGLVDVHFSESIPLRMGLYLVWVFISCGAGGCWSWVGSSTVRARIVVGCARHARAMYYVCDISALRFWRTPIAAERLSRPRRGGLVDACTKVSVARSKGERWPGWFGLPVHVMALREDQRNEEGSSCVHVRSHGVPRESFVRMDSRLCVSSPELCFEEAGRRLSHIQLVLLGNELCGHYRLAPMDELGFVTAAPLTSSAKLRDFVAQSPGLCCENARRAVLDVADGLASPMESAVFELMCLARRAGGYGLPRPEVNTIAIEGMPYRCDFLWRDAGLAIEYESHEHHSAIDKLEKDSTRRAVIESAGIRVVTLTRAQVYNSHEFDRVVRIVARAVRFRIRDRSHDWNQRCEELRGEMLPGYLPGR